MKKWAFDPKNPKNRGFWALAIKILTYEQPMGSFSGPRFIFHDILGGIFNETKNFEMNPPIVIWQSNDKSQKKINPNAESFS